MQEPRIEITDADFIMLDSRDVIIDDLLGWHLFKLKDVDPNSCRDYIITK